AAVSSFRNAHSPRPYLSQRIHATPEQVTDSSSISSSSSSSRRRRRRRTPSRIAHWPAAAEPTCRHSSSNSSSNFVVRGADGRVEVRAAGGNARLTLSASGTVAEADYAVALPPGPFVERTGARVWVTRRFLVGRSAAPSFDDVPPEFSHALSVAVRESRSAAATAAARVETGGNSGGGGGDFSLGRVGPAAAAVAAAGGAVSRKGGEGGLVAVELPRPEERPDHASWDTVQQGPSLDSHRDPLAPLGYYFDRRWCDSADPTSAARAAPGSASAAPAGGRLLSVDVMKLAEGQGYAGELAAVVESTGCCTYRIVVGDGGHHRRAGEGGVGVHVVVHADGSEVWLESDFVRLHPVGNPAAAAVAAASAVAAAAEAGGGWTSMSLGAIASRAIALRQQFLRCSGNAAAAAGGRGAGEPQVAVKIR
ncbi:unnamed protein product, partial [Ectocarpus sp. 12 AP-2014]